MCSPSVSPGFRQPAVVSTQLRHPFVRMRSNLGETAATASAQPNLARLLRPESEQPGMSQPMHLSMAGRAKTQCRLKVEPKLTSPEAQLAIRRKLGVGIPLQCKDAFSATVQVLVFTEDVHLHKDGNLLCFTERPVPAPDQEPRGPVQEQVQAPVQAKQEVREGEGWFCFTSRTTGRVYYWNEITNASTVEAPIKAEDGSCFVVAAPIISNDPRPFRRQLLAETWGAPERDPVPAMDFDELDELEDRQRWALQEIQRTKAQHLQRAAQEQYRQRLAQSRSRPAEEGSCPDADASPPIGLAGFHPMWNLRPAVPEAVLSESEVPEAPEAKASEAAKAKPRRRGFAQFQETQSEKSKASELTHQPKEVQSTLRPQSAMSDPMQAFADRLMAHAQELRIDDRHQQQLWMDQQVAGLPVMSREAESLDEPPEVPALNAMIAILDEEEEEEKEFERLKPYLPELGQATSSIVLAGKEWSSPGAADGSNPFVTQAVEVFQRYYPDVDLSSAFGDHYKEVLRAAAHKSARGGHIEKLQLMNVEMAEEDKERRNLLRDLRQRRYLLQEGRRALGSIGDTKIGAKAATKIPEALALGLGAPNGLLFPGMEATDSAEQEVCFPRMEVEVLPKAAKPKSKPLGLLASLKLDQDISVSQLGCEQQDEEPFTLEELTGLPQRKKVQAPAKAPAHNVSRAEKEEADRQLRIPLGQSLCPRALRGHFQERRLQRDKANALEKAALGKVMSWGPASKIAS
eukprot:g17018.t1